jgi:hypothetical protein
MPELVRVQRANPTPDPVLADLDLILAHGYGELRVVITDGVILSFAMTTYRLRAAPAYRP